jgi:arylsulfatase A-like enzyme
MAKINRRDFLKLYTALAAGAAFSGIPKMLSSARSNGSGKPNILVFVFDAMSARHLSLYGYSRKTTPNLEKFAERASVYHQHYSAANFTSPGTASMLTGMYPWTHRAFTFRGMIERALADRNLFQLVGKEYTRVAFTQNQWADILLSQFDPALDSHLPCDAYSLADLTLFQSGGLPRDRAMDYYVFQDFLSLRTLEPHPYPGSLLIASTELARVMTTDKDKVSAEYPRGVPNVYDFSYENISVLDGIRQLIQNSLSQDSPYLGYFHLWSPHGPYNARKDFIGIFKDDLKVPSKPHHAFASDDFSEEETWRNHLWYDEIIAELDADFGRVLSDLESAGVLQNSYVVVTSDHGELFERGEIGHASALMYAPVTHVPLLISAPGQQTRSDFHSLTSNLDLMPTLVQIAGQQVPDWVEGRLLPGFGGTEDSNRSIFSMVAKDNAAFRPIQHGSFALLKSPYELIYYTGYPGHPDAFELYNLQEDPDELQDLFTKDINTASQMKNELLEAIDTANRNYQKK